MTSAVSLAAGTAMIEFRKERMLWQQKKYWYAKTKTLYAIL